MITAMTLEQKIRRAIPLSAAMQFSIMDLSQEAIRVSAPLEPNVNIHGTGFAGSLFSVGLLTGWALGTHILEELGIEAELVVAKAEIRYRAPVSSDLSCSCNCSAAQREQLQQRIDASGKGTLLLDIEIGSAGQALLQATYFAITAKTSA